VTSKPPVRGTNQQFSGLWADSLAVREKVLDGPLLSATLVLID
jgi:hypothetical protein